MELRQRPFGHDAQDREATLWTLGRGALEVDVLDRGATVVAVRVPDRQGTVADVVLGFDDVTGYASADNPYFGATVGRVCNRIAGASFELDGTPYALTACLLYTSPSPRD